MSNYTNPNINFNDTMNVSSSTVSDTSSPQYSVDDILEIFHNIHMVPSLKYEPDLSSFSYEHLVNRLVLDIPGVTEKGTTAFTVDNTSEVRDILHNITTGSIFPMIPLTIIGPYRVGIRQISGPENGLTMIDASTVPYQIQFIDNGDNNIRLVQDELNPWEYFLVTDDEYQKLQTTNNGTYCLDNLTNFGVQFFPIQTPSSLSDDHRSITVKGTPSSSTVDNTIHNDDVEIVPIVPLDRSSFVPPPPPPPLPVEPPRPKPVSTVISPPVPKTVTFANDTSTSNSSSSSSSSSSSTPTIHDAPPEPEVPNGPSKYTDDKRYPSYFVIHDNTSCPVNAVYPKINNERKRLDVDPTTMLMEVLRTGLAYGMGKKAAAALDIIVECRIVKYYLLISRNTDNQYLPSMNCITGCHSTGINIVRDIDNSDNKISALLQQKVHEYTTITDSNAKPLIILVTSCRDRKFMTIIEQAREQGFDVALITPNEGKAPISNPAYNSWSSPAWERILKLARYEVPGQREGGGHSHSNPPVTKDKPREPSVDNRNKLPPNWLFMLMSPGIAKEVTKDTNVLNYVNTLAGKWTLPATTKTPVALPSDFSVPLLEAIYSEDDQGSCISGWKCVRIKPGILRSLGLTTIDETMTIFPQFFNKAGVSFYRDYKGIVNRMQTVASKQQSVGGPKPNVNPVGPQPTIIPSKPVIDNPVVIAPPSKTDKPNGNTTSSRTGKVMMEYKESLLPTEDAVIKLTNTLVQRCFSLTSSPIKKCTNITKVDGKEGFNRGILVLSMEDLPPTVTVSTVVAELAKLPIPNLAFTEVPPQDDNVVSKKPKASSSSNTSNNTSSSTSNNSSSSTSNNSSSSTSTTNTTSSSTTKVPKIDKSTNPDKDSIVKIGLLDMIKKLGLTIDQTVELLETIKADYAALF